MLHEEIIPQTFLNKPGKIKVTENAYLCEFGEPDSLVSDTTPVEEVAPKKTRKKANPDAATKKKTAKPKKIKKLLSRMPRELCGRPMSLEEYKSFITTGSTPPIMDFKSKKGRPFAAILNLKDNGNFEFKFVSRKGLTPEQGGDAPKEKKVKEKTTTNKAKVVKKAKQD
ncbi:MAG: topoisomerase C-terminal repeat-containing protein [Bdellovibrionota bacterium]